MVLSRSIIYSQLAAYGIVNENNATKIAFINRKLYIVLLLCIFFSVNAMAQYGGGNGTEGDPYIISTAAHLSALASNVNGGNDYSGKYFLVTEDITSTAVTTVIGKYDSFFRGNFNGNGKTIKLNISVGQYEWGALFGYISGGANIHDVVVSGNVSGGYIAGIVAELKIMEM